MRVAALAAGAVFNKGVIQFVPQPVSFGREDSHNAAVVELRIDQSPHQFFPEGGRGAVGDVKLICVGVEVDERLAVPAVSFAGRARCCRDCSRLFFPTEALPDFEGTGRSLSIMQLRQNALLLTVTKPRHQIRLVLLPPALSEPVPPNRSLLLRNPINKYKPILTSNLTIPLNSPHEILILLQAIQPRLLGLFQAVQQYNFVMSESQSNPNNAPFSLIKYEAEIEISDNVAEYQRAKHNQKPLDPSPSPEDVLNNMILPRDWKAENGKHFMQYVSHQKSERSDVVRLKEALDQTLQHRQARTQGICPIREELFSQAFDEIIREVTINSPQRGLLLMRVRDQHIMTLAAYQTLYQSSVNFGMRKILQSEEGMDELQQLLREAQAEKSQLEQKKIELLSKKESLEKKIFERKAMEGYEREDELIQIQEQENALAKFFASLKEGSKAE